MTVFFLSDYGTEDEFVGVVHAVLAATSPGLTIIDLTHHVPAFDVRAGSHTLVRASPHLGPGVVLAVVDPGVGSERRGLCVAVTPIGNGPSFFVGPDNGLLVAAAEQVGEAPIARAFELHRPAEAGGGADPAARGRSFDGRDLFGPAAAALCGGGAPEELGDPIDPLSLVRLPGGVVEHGRWSDGRRCLRAEVLWIDHFGNVQLAATAVDAQMAELPRDGSVEVAPDVPDPPTGTTVRRVEVFAELERGELGLLLDANGRLALVAGEAPAARALRVVAGQILVLTW
jgi:S-adenosyl-L-methionine hydrolase (adenosine-forming)